MTGQSEVLTPRDRFLQAANKELAAFEQREREFRKAERKERAAQLQLPADRVDTASHMSEWLTSLGLQPPK
jgi:hypothetical protein